MNSQFVSYNGITKCYQPHSNAFSVSPYYERPFTSCSLASWTLTVNGKMKLRFKVLVRQWRLFNDQQIHCLYRTRRLVAMFPAIGHYPERAQSSSRIHYTSSPEWHRKTILVGDVTSVFFKTFYNNDTLLFILSSVPQSLFYNFCRSLRTLDWY